MTKHIDILLAGPPSIDFPSFVCVQDEQGAPVTLGQWIGPDDSSPFWRYRLTPAELLMHMIADTEQLAGQPIVVMSDRTPRSSAAVTQEILNTSMSARAKLRERLAKAPLKVPGQTVAAFAALDPAATEPCPECHALFNPAVHQLVDCMSCGASKCTAKCITNSALPCLDCQALQPDDDEGGFDASGGPPQAEIKSPALRAKVEQLKGEAAAATASRLFDGTFHGKAGDSAKEDDEND